jgi:hypothetical protein
MAAASLDKCEYKRCGTNQDREVRWPRKAYILMTIGNREWRVCEHCMDLLTTEARLLNALIWKQLLPASPNFDPPEEEREEETEETQ